MPAGRPRKPDELKKLRGTLRKDRIVESIAVEKINDISLILDLKNFKVLKTTRAKDIFIQKANQLIKLKILSDMDIEQLVVYSSSLDILFDCLKEMNKEMFVDVYTDEGKLM